MESNWRKGPRDGQETFTWKKHDRFHGKRKQLEPGFVGFIATCSGKAQERSCVREAYNLLNEFTDENPPDKDVKVDEIEESLESEIEAMKKEGACNLKKFQQVEGGTKGTIFIKTTLPDPVKLAYSIVTHLAENKSKKSRFLMRLIPVEITCRANLDEIGKNADILIEKYFLIGYKTFSIQFRHNFNDKIKRDDVIECLAAKVIEKNPTNSVDLKTPNLAIMVEIFRSICCLSVLPDYFKYKKYNLLELAGSKEGNDEERPSEKIP